MSSQSVAPVRSVRAVSPVPLVTGFTIVELMVALSVLAILLALAVPSFTNATLGARLSSFANNLLASTQLARSEAIKRNAQVTLCRSVGGLICEAGSEWRDGWIVLVGTTVLQRQQALPAEFSITQTTGTIGEIIFPATVVGVIPATFTVCRANPAGSQRRIVTVTASGSASVRTEDGGCT